MIISMHQKDKATLVGNQTGVITSTAMIVRCESSLRLCFHQNIYKICETHTKAAFKASNDYCTGKLNYVILIHESIWFAMIDSRIDSVRNILIRCTPSYHIPIFQIELTPIYYFFYFVYKYDFNIDCYGFLDFISKVK